MKRLALACISLFAVATSGHHVAAQDAYPTKPIRLLIPAAPGGNPDLLGRLLAQRLTILLGKPVIPENMPGAGGVVAAEVVAKSPPEPHLLMLGDSAGLAINVALNPAVTYQPVRDLTPVTAVATVPSLLVVNPALGVSTLDEFILLAKSKPEQINFGSAGQGSIHHLTMAALAAQTGVKLTHVPYRGGSPMVAGVLSGQVDAAWSGLPNVKQAIEDGRLRVLCSSFPERSPILPNVPTAAELGVKGFDVNTMIGVQTTAGVPPDIVAKLQRAIATALREPDVSARLDQLGIVLQENGTEHYARFMREDIEHFAKVVKAAGVTVGN